MNILIVDDSTSFRKLLRRVVARFPGHEVVGTFSTGKLAMQMIEQRQVDVLLLDLQMPEMDGFQVLDALLASASKCKVIAFCEPGERLAAETKKARRLGAAIVVPKPATEADLDSEVAPLQLALAEWLDLTAAPRTYPDGTAGGAKAFEGALTAPSDGYKRVAMKSFEPMLVVVASSTGGPDALEILVSRLSGPPRIPVLLAQHMPETFTRNLAMRLAHLTGIECREAVNGEAVKPGTILIAPGNFHMRLQRQAEGNVLMLDQGPRVNSVRPAADLLFYSAAELYGSTCAGFVLTGMGEDGASGCKAIKQAGGGIMIQSPETCAVWGMPAAVQKAHAFDSVGDLSDCATQLAQFCNQKKVA